MPTKQPNGESTWVDPDDAPPLTKDFFDRAELRHGDTVIRPGRPPLPDFTAQAAPDLDPALLARLRATGPHWPARTGRPA